MLSPRSAILATCCLAAALVGGCATAPRGLPPDLPMHVDTRHGHDRAYPDVGATLARLPRDAYWLRAAGERFWFEGGVWFRAAPGGFVVAAAPPGAVVPVLPPVYTTLRVAAIQYYYANDVYYRYDAGLGGFVVVAPPAAEPAPASGVAAEPFAYPERGQSPEQQARDREECRRWAVAASGYDPTRPELAAGASGRDGFFRAMSACFGGRGYTAR